MHNIACSLTNKTDIRRLGLKLGVKANKIDAIFCNKNGDITEAAYEILKEWRKGQGDPKTAFITLRDALTHPDVNLHQEAQEALPFNWLGSFEGADNWANLILTGGNHLEDTLSYKPLQSLGFFGRALTDDAMEQLSRRLSKDDMKRLTPELDISPEEVNTSYAKYCTDPTAVTTVNRDLLKDWLNNQNSREEAYVLMGEALIRARLKLIARKVLNYPPAEGENQLKSGIKRKRQSNRNRDKHKKMKKVDGLSVKP